jgi:hypothetical protein
MKYYTTYNTILSGMEEGSEAYIKWIETRITGNRRQYGMDTPIYMVDLLDMSAMPEVATLLDYCVQDTRTIKTIIALELVKGHLGPWLEYTNNDSKLFDLIVFSELYLDSQQESTIRYDYCGDPIPGSGDVSKAQINARIAEIEALYAEWTYTVPAQSIYTWTAVGATARTNDPLWGGYVQPGIGTSWVYLTGPDDAQQDPFNFSYGLSQQILGDLGSANIDTMMAGNPDFYYQQSEAIKTAMLGVGVPYYYQRVQIFPRNGAEYGDHLAESARYVARAAINAAKMAIRASGCLSTVILLTQQSLTEYRSNTYAAATRNFLRINELSSLLMPVPAAPESEPQYAMEKQIIDTVYAKRYELLHDINYIKSFDLDFTNSLSDTERFNMEKDVRAQMKATALTLVTSIRGGLIDSYTNMNSLDSVASIIRPLLL